MYLGGGTKVARCECDGLIFKQEVPGKNNVDESTGAGKDAGETRVGEVGVLRFNVLKLLLFWLGVVLGAIDP